MGSNPQTATFQTRDFFQTEQECIEALYEDVEEIYLALEESNVEAKISAACIVIPNQGKA